MNELIKTDCYMQICYAKMTTHKVETKKIIMMIERQKATREKSLMKMSNIRLLI